MNSLTKRVGALEKISGTCTRKNFLWVNYASDGGLVCDGRFYADSEALLSALGINQGQAHVLGWQPGKTAAELLAEAAEWAKNPPPEVSRDDLGEYGKQLVDEGILPIVAQHLEKLCPNGRA